MGEKKNDFEAEVVLYDYSSIPPDAQSKRISVQQAKDILTDKAIIVPKEPTEEMLKKLEAAIWENQYISDDGLRCYEDGALELIYKAMTESNKD